MKGKKDNNFPLRSKSFWSGVGLIIYGILKYLLFGELDLEAIMMGLGIIGLRHAIEKKR